MSYRTRTLLKAAAGLVLVSGLALYAYYGVYKAKRREAREKMEAGLVFQMDKKLVVRVEVEAGKKRAVLIRAGRDERDLPAWRLVEPVEAEADGISVNGLLGTLELMDAERSLEEASDETLRSYGLAPPRGSVAATTGDGERFGLLIGKKSSFDNLLYVQREGESSVLLVKGYLAGSLLKTPFDLSRKEVLQFDEKLVRGITIREGGATSVLRRDGDIWHLREPLDDLADPDEVDAILKTLLNLRAITFPDSVRVPLGAYGLDPPTLVAELSLGLGDEVRAVALGTGTLPTNREYAYARRTSPEGRVAKIRPYQLGVLQKRPFELRAKAPLVFDPAEVFKIKSTSDEELVVLEKRIEERPAEREGADPSRIERWELVAPRAVPAKKHMVTGLLVAIGGLKARRFAGDKAKASPADSGLDAPVRTITLYDRDGQSLGELTIGRSSASGTFVAGTSRPQVCVVDARALESLRITATTFEDAPENALEKP